ncbi:lycopene cyclase domain-containing protein [Microbacterium terricola]|uniref:Lycopene cyclase domain-containing protein n=1 Tax=Microbacterium terricola TaxID=344163 RepID=A0ABM8DZ61_9MICO|nr:lycopene cyclase domain-containing protein [Microbacterium terricola]UYK41244.1 lycopene cyclase domain-containing protein [Microbacterium terricola]BDV30978.1 hypothetical protein Microterr_16380 [Microbacterium terricola]
MAGAYLIAILLSFAGMLVLDLRLDLIARRSPARTAVAVAVGTLVLLVWDLTGIAAGIFVRGDSPLFVGVDLAPHLPLEEPVFLAFLCYLALVLWAGAERLRARREKQVAVREETAP